MKNIQTILSPDRIPVDNDFSPEAIWQITVLSKDTKEMEQLCLRWLTARDYSKHELLQKLTARGYQGDSAFAVINGLAQDGWQDDKRYAENYIRSRILKGYGPARILYELQQKGIVPGDVTENGFAQNEFEAIVEKTAGGWLELVQDVYQRKFGQDEQVRAMDWVKRSRFLMQRGFSGAMISELRKHLNIKLI